MSETITAPAEATEAPAATDSPISVSEAARLLRSQRQPAAPPAPAPTPTPTGPDAAREMAEALGLKPEQIQEQPAEPPPGIDVDGRRLNIDDVRRALAHQTDYTRKTQQLADQQRAVQAQQEALASVLPYLQPELQRLQEQIQGAPPPARDLAETNPGEYLKQLAAWQHAQSEQQRLGQLLQMDQHARASAMQRQVEESNRILAEEFPQWKDLPTRGRWQAEIADWARKDAGYTDAELHQLTDHRHLKVLMKAMAYDRMLAGARTAAPTPRLQSAPLRGTPPPAPQSAQVSNAQQAFEARPNFRTGTAYL